MTGHLHVGIDGDGKISVDCAIYDADERARVYLLACVMSALKADAAIAVAAATMVALGIEESIVSGTLLDVDGKGLEEQAKRGVGG